MLYPLEVSCNSLQNLVGLAFSVTLGQPLGSIECSLAIVATIYAMTQGQNVFWDGSRAVGAGQRNPVIHRQRVPKTLQYNRERISAQCL